MKINIVLIIFKFNCTKVTLYLLTLYHQTFGKREFSHEMNMGYGCEINMGMGR